MNQRDQNEESVGSDLGIRVSIVNIQWNQMDQSDESEELEVS